MLLWIICALLTALAVAWSVRPLVARTIQPSVRSSADIYRAQLAELGREVEIGALSATAAEEARREIGRRLIAADAAGTAPQGRSHAKAGLLLALAIPAVALAAYIAIGRPDLEGRPLAARDMNADLQTAPLDQVAEYLFEKLAMDPAHPDGWMLLGRTYMRLGRYAEAASAFAEAARQLGDAAPAELHSAHGEALTLATGGRVTEAARAAFEAALKVDPKEPSARFYLAVAKSQAGDTPGAIADLEALLAETAPDAPYRGMIEAKIEELKAPAVKDMPEVRAMVDSLAARLEAEPHNLEGWLLLITSYVRLEETDRAREALATARAEFEDEPESLAALTAKARELGLES